MVIRNHDQKLPRQAQVRLESTDWQWHAYRADADCCTLAPGQNFALGLRPRFASRY